MKAARDEGTGGKHHGREVAMATRGRIPHAALAISHRGKSCVRARGRRGRIPPAPLTAGHESCLVSAVPLSGTLFLRSGARELPLAASNGGGAQRWAVEIALLVPRPPAPSPAMGPRGWGSHAATGRGGEESRAAMVLDSPELGQRRSGSWLGQVWRTSTTGSEWQRTRCRRGRQSGRDAE
ncbi:hypothetical protein OsJ_18838 [Oryza sativa Japonica Group]|uniref:Uncharacterized protein n=1 Tax=Oryza sativa subsp. japonica TaxID=39947 RepID=B9FJJ2_ORYSJ|nr:hypothetical protein OsJ_18838 [Oryza sativa Japonica Group]